MINCCMSLFWGSFVYFSGCLRISGTRERLTYLQIPDKGGVFILKNKWNFYKSISSDSGAWRISFTSTLIKFKLSVPYQFSHRIEANLKERKIRKFQKYSFSDNEKRGNNTYNDENETDYTLSYQ